MCCAYLFFRSWYLLFWMNQRQGWILGTCTFYELMHHSAYKLYGQVCLDDLPWPRGSQGSTGVIFIWFVTRNYMALFQRPWKDGRGAQAIGELLAYDFMQRAILAVIAISIFSPILGSSQFLVVRAWWVIRWVVSSTGVAVGIFLGQSTHLDDRWLWDCAALVLDLSGSVTSIIWRFQRLASCQWVGSGSYS